MKSSNFFSVALVALAASACGPREHMSIPDLTSETGTFGSASSPSLSGGTGQRPASQSAGAQVPGFDQISPLLKAKCAACHGKSHPKDWQDYATTVANKDLIFRRVIILQDMPMGAKDNPSIGFKTEELNLLARWLKGGTPKETASLASSEDPNSPTVVAGPPAAEVGGGQVPSQPPSPPSEQPVVTPEVPVAPPVAVPPPAMTTPPAVAMQCVGCHGMTGMSSSPMFPNLAGQKYDYLVKQLKAFRGENNPDNPSVRLPPTRTDAMMNMFSASLSDTDIEEISRFFSNQKSE